MRLCVIALNPAIDAEWRVDDVIWEEKNIVHAQRRWPGGKGVNVARWLKFLGTDTELLIPLGGTAGREMLAGLRAQRLRAHVVKLREDTRVNVVVTTAAGRQMRFNPPGPNLSRDEWRRILSASKQTVARGNSLVLSGALPRGVSIHAYAQLIRIAHAHDRKCFLDCDGPALTAGVRAKPFLVKPNLHELSLWSGSKLRTERSTTLAAARMSRITNGWVFVSLGEAGALLVNERENFAMRGTPPRMHPVNTVGAGDALLAAVVTNAARNAAPEEWLRAGIAAGTAATQQRAGQLSSPALIRRISRQIALQRIQAL